MRFLALLLPACAVRHRGALVPQVAEPPPVALPTPVARPVAPPPHPDFAALRPLRNYYRLVALGPLRHHFQVFYHHHELAYAYYQVSPETRVPERSGSGFGTITERPPPEPVPTEVADLAAAVAADLSAVDPSAAAVQVLYLGLYRTLTVEEIVVGPPAPAGPRRTVRRRTLTADADLSELDGPARFALDLGGTLRLDDPESRADRPGWIVADLGRHAGHLLWDAYADPPDPTVAREAFDQAVLDAARRRERGEPDPPLASLPAEQDPRTIPAHLVQSWQLSLSVDTGRDRVSVRADVDPRRTLGGGLERFEVTVTSPSSRPFTARATLRSDALPAGVVGEVTAPLTVDYWFGGPGPAAAGSVTAPARWLVDGDRALLLDPAVVVPEHTFPATEAAAAPRSTLRWMRRD